MKFMMLNILLASVVHTSAVGQSRPEAGIDATLASESFGYKLKCVINGHDMGFAGESQDVTRFIGESQALHLGRNTVEITYTKQPSPHIGLDLNVQFTIPGYPAPLFYAHVADAKIGKLDGSFDIAATAPKDFRPLYLSEYPKGAAGFLYLDQDAAASGDFSLTINGNEGPATYSGRLRYAVPLPRLQPGVNRVVATFDTHGGPLRLFIVGPTAVTSRVLDSSKKTTVTFSIVGVAP